MRRATPNRHGAKNLGEQLSSMPDTPETEGGYRHPLSKVFLPGNLRSISLENRGSVARDHVGIRAEILPDKGR